MNNMNNMNNINNMTIPTIETLYHQEIPAHVNRSLMEDFCYGPDATTLAIIDPQHTITAHFVSREAGIVCGTQLLGETFTQVHMLLNSKDPAPTITINTSEGSKIESGEVIATVYGDTSTILMGERTALNYLTHLSGIATTTNSWVQTLAGTTTHVRDTRKTLPGLRILEKYAVHCGGGINHRLGLGDAILIKDNHIHAAGDITRAYQHIIENNPHNLPIEVEVDALEQLDAMLAVNAPLILLDNFPLWQTQIAVSRRNTHHQRTGHYAQLESSGNITLDVAYNYAKTGVNYLAIGALTHTITPLDIGLDIIT